MPIHLRLFLWNSFIGRLRWRRLLLLLPWVDRLFSQQWDPSHFNTSLIVVITGKINSHWTLEYDIGYCLSQIGHPIDMLYYILEIVQIVWFNGTQRSKQMNCYHGTETSNHKFMIRSIICRPIRGNLDWKGLQYGIIATVEWRTIIIWINRVAATLTGENLKLHQKLYSTVCNIPRFFRLLGYQELRNSEFCKISFIYLLDFYDLRISRLYWTKLLRRVHAGIV